jgi:magnesium transporter
VSKIDLGSPVALAMLAVRTAIHAGCTAEEARRILRERHLDHHLFYVYVIDEQDRLLGQVSARRLLLSRGEEPITQLMHPCPATVSFHETAGAAFETLASLRQLALPVVDDGGRLLGVVDVTAWAADASDRLEGSRHEFFGRLGAAVEEHRMGGPLQSFVLRMPWLLCNIASGLACAFIADAHAHLLEAVIVLAAFIPMVLTVSESIGVQAGELSLQLLRTDGSMAAFLRRIRHEAGTSLLLGAGCGALVAAASLLFASAGERRAIVLTLLLSVLGAMLTAAAVGSLVPRALRRIGLNPKFASGPVTLMVVDVASTIIYLGIGTAIFRPLLGDAAVSLATAAVP